ncbi:MAG: hypothetical protein IJ246_08655 [Clostridia bacterium]|nr:hypothetical protein [Clostridia bacterium]
MRRLWGVLFLCFLFLLIAPAQADTTLYFDRIFAECTLDESQYIILTPDNLAMHQEWMANRDLTEESLLADWESRGVMAQAWSTQGDACLEFTAVKDETANTYFDLDQQTAAIRAHYRSQHLKGTLYGDEGYTYQSAEWKLTTQYGRFLMLQYKRTVGDETYRGYARRAVRNGYTITLDYKVFDRSLRTADVNALNKVVSTWHYTQVLPLSAQSDDPQSVPVTLVSQTAMSFTKEPPAETNTGSFQVKGTCDPNLHVIGVVMRMSGSNPVRVEADATKKGNFTLDVTLPEEGTWLMTLTFVSGNQVVGEKVFGTTLFQKTLLTVNFDTPVPDQFTADKFTLSGVTMKSTKIQLIVDGIMDKSVTAGSGGKFSFKIPTSQEQTYNITLSFQKKGYTTRRFTWTATRTLTEEEKREKIKEAAIKPAYQTLTEKLSGYNGRIMTYAPYITEIQESEGETIVFMAMRNSKKSGYSQRIVVIAPEAPPAAIGSQCRFYGTLNGTYEVLDEENGSRFYPCFDLLYWVDPST